MAWKHGRTWCNTVCPVGTVLGLLSRFSLFKVRIIDTAKCNGCGLCATKCKASCINSKEHAIDYSRCVDCLRLPGSMQAKGIGLPKRTTSRPCAIITGHGFIQNVVFWLQDCVIAGAAQKLLSQAKESVASLEGKRHTKRESIIPRGSVSRNIFNSNVHPVIFVSCSKQNALMFCNLLFMEYGLAGECNRPLVLRKDFCNFDCTVYGRCLSQSEQFFR